MSNPELRTEMIRRILPDIDIGRIKFTQKQRTSKHSPDTRGVRFDVFAKSDNRKIFDCKVQTSDKKNLPRRTRAYHTVLGLEALKNNTLKKSGTYNYMPDEFVIFICTFDPFRRGRHFYSFSNICNEDNGLKLSDGAVTIFLNARGTMNDINDELKVFLDFMLGKSSDDPFIVQLEERLNAIKHNSEWRQNYMLLLSREDERYYDGTAGEKVGEKRGEKRGRSEILNEAIDFMKSKGNY